MKIGEQIKRIRMSKGLSQTDLANIADVNQGYLTRIESDQVNPTIKFIYRLLEALGCDISIIDNNK